MERPKSPLAKSRPMGFKIHRGSHHFSNILDESDHSYYKQGSMAIVFADSVDSDQTGSGAQDLFEEESENCLRKQFLESVDPHKLRPFIDMVPDKLDGTCFGSWSMNASRTGSLGPVIVFSY